MNETNSAEISLKDELRCALSMQEQYEIVKRRTGATMWKNDTPVVRPNIETCEPLRKRKRKGE